MAIYGQILDAGVLSAEEAAQDAARKVLLVTTQAISDLTDRINAIKVLVSEGGGKVAVVARIPDANDKTELQEFYTAAKNIIEGYSPSTVDDL